MQKQSYTFCEHGGFCRLELKGNFILAVAPEIKFLMVFFVFLWGEIIQFLKNKSLFYAKILSSFTGNIFHVAKN